MGCPFHNISHISEFDALDKDARAFPWPYYDWLRENAPSGVYKLPYENSYYVIHHFEDVKNAFNDTDTFSSEIIPVMKSPFLALMNGSEHTRIRQIVSELFTNSFLETYNSEITTIIKSATNDLLSKSNGELFQLWADKIPLAVLSLLFGFPQTDEAIRKLHDDNIIINRALFVTGGTGPRRSPKPTITEKIKISWAILSNAGKLFKLRKLLGRKNFSELLQMVKPLKVVYETPRPDFSSIPSAIEPMLDLMLHFAKQFSCENQTGGATKILNEAIKTQKATFAEMMMAGSFIIFAGYETTSSILSNCCVHLAGDKKLFLQLKRFPEKINDFIEEALRYYTPVGRFLRRTTKDVEIGGTVIPQNSIVILLSGAANTDPLKFNNGCEFDRNRTNVRQHLSFGKGAHFCIGAPLARLQIQRALSTLISEADKLIIDKLKPMQMVVDRDNGILRYDKVYMKS